MKLSPSVEDTESLVWLGVVSLITINKNKNAREQSQTRNDYNSMQARRKFFMKIQEG